MAERGTILTPRARPLLSTLPELCRSRWPCGAPLRGPTVARPRPGPCGHVQASEVRPALWQGVRASGGSRRRSTTQRVGTDRADVSYLPVRPGALDNAENHRLNTVGAQEKLPRKPGLVLNRDPLLFRKAGPQDLLGLQDQGPARRVRRRPSRGLPGFGCAFRWEIGRCTEEARGALSSSSFPHPRAPAGCETGSGGRGTAPGCRLPGPSPETAPPGRRLGVKLQTQPTCRVSWAPPFRNICASSSLETPQMSQEAQHVGKEPCYEGWARCLQAGEGRFSQTRGTASISLTKPPTWPLGTSCTAFLRPEPEPEAPRAFKPHTPPGAGHREQEQLPDPEPQELSPLNKDTATTVQLCTAEEAEWHQKDIARLLQRQKEEERKWAQQVEDRELQLQERLEEQRHALDRQREEALRALRASCEQEKAALTHSFQEAKAALQDTIAELGARLEAFQARMKRVEESILTRDYKKHIQDYGSPSHFWEQELESLHFVVEMKNERIHELDKRLILMETVKEKNLMLEEKITTLQQENEDLHVRARNQAVVSRQLSEDLFLAREALEKESHIRQQLQREKEELLYRVLGADTSSTFPLASVTPTEVSFLAT
ncbi:coiled-coil domain-containing protein 69 [Fukomys damarensis]|uniref:coiled-coil domain-containing protein 69 n=1 Tax=Fukomys damarensis TaxID=885580 RepID=UPI0014551F2A|nr:coiled-coil domain-containing protein 69 [Fukomys damarensis]